MRGTHPRRLDVFRAQVAAFLLAVIHEVGEDAVSFQRTGIARDDHLLSGTGERHVQLAVYQFAVLYEVVGGEEIHLPLPLDGEAIDDDIPLAALITFYGVDGDVHELGKFLFFQSLPDEADLVSVGNDDAQGSLGVEFLAHKSS